MTLKLANWVRCDRCGTDAKSSPSAVVARSNAWRNGWQVDRSGDLCPFCWQAVMHGADRDGVA